MPVGSVSNPRLECQHFSGNPILNSPLKEMPHCSVKTMCGSGCTPGTRVQPQDLRTTHSGKFHSSLGQVVGYTYQIVSESTLKRKKKNRGQELCRAAGLCLDGGTGTSQSQARESVENFKEGLLKHEAPFVTGP